jgi:predicted RND superfamily exporter protein
MLSIISALYEKVVLKRPLLTLSVFVLCIIFFSIYVSDFKLDASADSLILENDVDLRYYRSSQARYGSDDNVVLTYTPEKDLFSPESLSGLRELRDSLSRIERVETVASILDVPLINSPPISLSEANEEVRRLDDPSTDISLAKKELLNSPLYKNLMVSPDGNTTALRVIFKRDEILHSLMKRRDELRERELMADFTRQEADELTRVSDKYKEKSFDLMDRESRDISTIRDIMDQYRDKAELFLGGVPMITSDMINFIRHDLSVFGVGILCFLILMLEIFFRKARWVFISIVCCFATVLFMFGFIGLAQWRVTVVSSNFTSLLLIITLSLTVHLIVRYHELYTEHTGADQYYLISETMKSKAVPSIYTALTTIVAFGSLMVSGIRPVIDFGWMMSIGVCAAFLISFTFFPASLMLMKPKVALPGHDYIGALTHAFSNLVQKHGKLILVSYIVVALLSVMGISKLTVENRFIDHFKKTTEIYRGMEMIDKELGGTAPLDVIVDAPADFFASEAEEDIIFDDEFDIGLDDESDAEAGLSGTSYWYNDFRIDTLQSIHDYLDDLPETGKVLSMATTLKMMRQMNEDKPLDNITLSVIHKKLPEEIKGKLFDPYMSADGNQVRFSTRVFESDVSLRRNELLKKVRNHLVNNIGLSEDQVHLTGMIVLYNNMLQSLYRSQILTIGVVFLMIMLMFIILFRSIKLAAIAIVPNLISAGVVLGIMGWMKIPLDIMTITIAAITIGIAVDNTIHYMHRFLTEIHKDNDYIAAMKRSHASIGRAMYYTSITIIIGFSILALSSFIPTIYFGMLTGLAMTVALIANLTLLPTLLLALKPE